MNKDMGAGALATRFVGLAPASNAAKHKSMHALALVPAADMDPTALAQRPADATESPFDAAAAAGGKRPLEDDDSELGARERTGLPLMGSYLT
jgi:hypothetical protein